MIRLYAYTENGRAPTARVARIGGIFRQPDSGLIRMTLIDGDENRPAAQVHLLWQPWEWLCLTGDGRLRDGPVPARQVR